jgi:hypothetical protein
MALPLVFLAIVTAIVFSTYAARLARPILSAYNVDMCVSPTARAKFFALDGPGRGTREIEYEVTEQGWTRLLITDVSGHPITTLVDGEAAPGRYHVSFDVSTLAAGTYLYVLQTQTGR